MKSFIVDTVATVVFFTVIATLTELFIAGMEPGEVLVTRLIMIPMMVLTGRPYGLWRDWVFDKLSPNALWYRVIIDCLAFLSFQVPIYVVTLLIAGADTGEVVTLVVSASIIMLVISRPFGLFLDGVRRWVN